LYTEFSVGWIDASLAAAKNGPGITLSPADTVSDASISRRVLEPVDDRGEVRSAPDCCDTAFEIRCVQQLQPEHRRTGSGRTPGHQNTCCETSRSSNGRRAT
jgi:hypothetical protein